MWVAQLGIAGLSVIRSVESKVRMCVCGVRRLRQPALPGTQPYTPLWEVGDVTDPTIAGNAAWTMRTSRHYVHCAGNGASKCAGIPSGERALIGQRLGWRRIPS